MVLSLFKEPKKKRKKTRRAYLIKAIDDLISVQVRGRDGNKCCKCGQKDRVYHHHIFGKKAHPSTRWDLENGITLCYHCHQDAHASPEDFRRWVLQWWMAEKVYEALYLRAQMRCSFKEIDLEWILKLEREKMKHWPPDMDKSLQETGI